MIKNIPQVLYCLKSGAAGLEKNKGTISISVITTAACLLLISAFALLSINIQSSMNQFQAQNTLLAFVHDSLTTSQAQALHVYISDIPGVEHVAFVSREEAMEEYLKAHGENENVHDNYLAPEVFRHRYVVELSNQANAGAVTEAIQHVSGIADIRIDRVVADGFAAIQNVVSVVGIFISILLLSIAIVIMTNTIKLSTYSRREEIAVMKMMGAYDNFIRLPFVFEGCIVGCLGATLSIILSSFFYLALGQLIRGSGILTLISFVPYSEVLLPIATANLLLGIAVGAVGSITSLKRHLAA